MTRKLEETFNLPEMENTFKSDLDDNLEVEGEEMPVEYADAEFDDPQEILNALTLAEKIDSALPTIGGLNKHDLEMDDVAKKALSAYSDLVDLAQNSEDKYTSRMYEVAGGMLRTAMDARNSKIDRKLKIVEMQLKKARLDLDSKRDVGGGANAEGSEFDRNELLKHIRGDSDGDDK